MVAREHMERFELAMLAIDQASALHDLAVTLRDEGVSQIDLYSLYRTFQQMIPGEDPLYDAVVDTMELILGGAWAKGRDLFPTELKWRA